jgi:hypothetical protein
MIDPYFFFLLLVDSIILSFEALGELYPVFEKTPEALLAACFGEYFMISEKS